ncbi:tetratricopeptide repeat protein [Deinococcus caeni]|uniref:tetratricopeptide repeat protein n=1 Tax=Deinococcus caeni TaxID=569127 RepID=UPI0036156894
MIAAYLLWRDGALPDAVERVTLSLNRLRLGPPSVWTGRGLNILAALQSQLNRPDLAVSLYQEQVDLARHIRDPELSATALHDLGVELRFSDPERARQHITEALLIFQGMDYAHGVAVAHANLADFAQRAGDHHATLHHTAQAMAFPFMDQQPTLEVEVQAARLHALTALNDPAADDARARLEQFSGSHANPEVQITARLALARRAPRTGSSRSSRPPWTPPACSASTSTCRSCTRN